MGGTIKRLLLIAMVVLLSSSIVLAQDFCKGDFTYDGDVDANDVTTFLEHFGRSQFNKPCPPVGLRLYVRQDRQHHTPQVTMEIYKEVLQW